MNNLNEKRMPIFSLYLSSGFTLLGFSILEIILSNLLWFRLSIPLTLMALIYWNVATPRNTGFFWTMFSGFILDLYLGYLLGIHVIVFLLASYFTQRYFHRFRALFRIQQSIIVAGIILIYQSYFILISKYFSISIFFEVMIITFVSSLFWPIIYGLLRYLRIKLTYGK
tara:strand:- start:5971 stop:6477 length:507 start_codon:yes stop_codon:yes gene_type:complete